MAAATVAAVDPAAHVRAAGVSGNHHPRVPARASGASRSKPSKSSGRVYIAELALRRSAATGLRTIPVEFDPVVVRVAEVEGLADAVVGGAFERDPGVDQPPSASAGPPRGSGRDRQVISPVVPRRRGRPPRLPRYQSDVVVVPARRQERRPVPEPLVSSNPRTLVKVERPRQVGDLEVDVADGNARVDRLRNWGGIIPTIGRRPTGAGTVLAPPFGGRCYTVRSMSSPAPPPLEYDRGDGDTLRPWNGLAFISVTLAPRPCPLALVVARAAGPSRFGQLATVAAVAAIAAFAIAEGLAALHHPADAARASPTPGWPSARFWLTLGALVALPRLAQ